MYVCACTDIYVIHKHMYIYYVTQRYFYVCACMCMQACSHTCLCVYVCVCTQSVETRMWKPEGDFGCRSSPSTMCVPRIELMFSDMVASIFTCWAILPAHLQSHMEHIITFYMRQDRNYECMERERAHLPENLVDTSTSWGSAVLTGDNLRLKPFSFPS